jgi:dUTP pyrophosphatase
LPNEPPAGVCIGVKRLPEGAGLPLPAYMTPDAAGADVYAAVATEVTLAPGARAFIPAGFSLEIPPGFEVQVRPRSGLALRCGVTLLNSPGTIDADYRGPVGVLMINFGSEAWTVKRGDRIAQLVVGRIERAAFEERDELRETMRTGGFGSTGW